jgi:hypothetical protein
MFFTNSEIYIARPLIWVQAQHASIQQKSGGILNISSIISVLNIYKKASRKPLNLEIWP